VKRNIARLVPSMKKASDEAREVMKPRGGRSRDTHHRRLRGRLQRGVEVHVVEFGVGVVIVVGRRDRRAGAVDRVGQVGGQRGVERHVVAHHADERRDVVVERREHRLVAVGPRHGHVLERHVVERRLLGGDVGRGERIAAGNQAFHLAERGLGRRHAGNTVMDALRLVAIVRGHGACDARQQACQTDLFQFRDLLGFHLPHPHPI
jgi:hypothetical protein